MNNLNPSLNRDFVTLLALLALRAGVAVRNGAWLIALAAFAISLAAPAMAAPREQLPSIERIEAIEDLADSDTRRAFDELDAFGKSLPADAEYALQWLYLKTRYGLEMELARLDDAAATVARIETLAQARKDELGLIFVEISRAAMQMNEGKTGAAMTMLDAVAARVEALGDAQMLAYFHRIVGNGHLSLGKFEKALDAYLRSLQFADKQPRRAAQSRLSSMNNLSNVYASMNNPEKALEILNEAIALAKRIGAKSDLATLYLNQGGAYASLHRTDEYIRANEMALKMARESGQVETEAVTLNNIADSWLMQHDYVKAETFARQSLERYKATENLSGIATARANIGFALMGQGKTTEGANQVRAALKLHHDADEIADEEAILGELSRMYERAGMYREAVAAIREQQQLSAKLFKTERERSVAALQEQFDAEQRQKQLEALARENRLKDAEIQNQQLQQTVTILGGMVAALLGVFIFLLYRRARDANQRLKEANQQLEFHSVRDALTGLFNRRSFLDLMKKRPVDGANRREGDHPDGLMVLDVDHFKAINDTYGHAAGDAVLVEVARRLRATVRESDMVIRWGGEEFLIYSPKATTQALSILADRVLRAVAATPVAIGGRSLTVTISGGFLSLPFCGVSESECNWEKALQIADMALYLGKVHGRNRAYGPTRLNVPFAEALPLLENDIAAALEAQMVDMAEVVGPGTASAA